MEKKIDCILTSCGRWDLLATTLSSFFEFVDFPIANFWVYEDSGQPIPEYFKTEFPLIQWIEPLKKTGQIFAIDCLYSKVENEYIMFLEDDWQFTKTGFIQKSLAILEEKPMTCQVWIREPNDRNGHPAIGQVITLESGVKYQLMKTGFRGVWHGFSFNPGLRRLSDYQKLFPKGMYADIHWSPSNPLQAEQLVGKQYFRHGFRAATLLEGYCKHIGNNRHVQP
jgi:hypothetical protein